MLVEVWERGGGGRGGGGGGGGGRGAAAGSLNSARVLGAGGGTQAAGIVAVGTPGPGIATEEYTFAGTATTETATLS